MIVSHSARQQVLGIPGNRPWRSCGWPRTWRPVWAAPRASRLWAPQTQGSPARTTSRLGRSAAGCPGGCSSCRALVHVYSTCCPSNGTSGAEGCRALMKVLTTLIWSASLLSNLHFLKFPIVLKCAPHASLAHTLCSVAAPIIAL